MRQPLVPAELHQPLPASNQLLVVAVRDDRNEIPHPFFAEEDKHEQHEA